MNAPTVESQAERTVKQLLKQKRSHKTGCTLTAENIRMLAENWLGLINHEVLKNWQPLLNDKTQFSLILREHDFELFKAARSLVQSINGVRKMIDLRIEEMNKLIEENRPLFDALNREYEEKLALKAAATPSGQPGDSPIVAEGTKVLDEAAAANDTPPAPEAA